VGDVVTCRFGQGEITKVAADGCCVAVSGDEEFRLRPGEFELVDTFNRSHAEALWNEILYQSGYVRAPKALWKAVNFEEWGFLCFLMEWMLFKVDAGIQELNRGWFYCKADMVEETTGYSEKVQRRLFRQLEGKGFVKTRMQYGRRRVRGKERWNNHRMIFIDLPALQKAARQQQKTAFTIPPEREG
jgi:hypothetical protein